jgi:dTDP-4-dehydrorhamnose 3,5-epimerase and related enzymes
VHVRELAIPDAYVFTPVQHADERGVFLEFYRFEALASAVGHSLDLRQGNISVSQRGVVRGVHYALVPPSQAKYVHAPTGAFLDIVVDIRVGSPTYGRWESVLIDDVDRRGVYLAEGLGHVLVALSDGATASYLTSAVFDPEREKAINVLDPELGIEFPFDRDALRLSPKDLEAPGLAEAADLGLLPTWDECKAYYDSLRTA